MTSIQEQVAVVQAYIHQRKDKMVQINTAQFNNIRNVMLLADAYSIAVKWFNNNNGSINKI